MTRSLALDAHGKSAQLRAAEHGAAGWRWERSRATTDRIGRILVAALALWSASAGAEVVRIDDHIARADEQRAGGRHRRPVRDHPREGLRRDRSLRARATRSSRTSARAAQRARKGRVRRHLRAGEAGRHGEERRRPALSGRQPRQRPGRRQPRGLRLARQRLAGGRHPDPEQPDDRGADREAEATDRRSPGRSLARFIDVPDGATTARFASASLGHAAALSAGRARAAAGDADVAHVGDLDAACRARRDDPRAPTGRSPIAGRAVAGHAAIPPESV